MNRALSRYFAASMLLAISLGLAGCKGMLDAKSGAQAGSNANANKPDAPDVTFDQLQGGTLSLASLKGKVVLVNFWATWCDPCRIEIPWMIGFQQKYSSRGFTILGVAMDDEGRKVVGPFVQNTQFDVDGQKMAMSYPILIGNDDISEKFGGLIGLPTSVLISRDGKIVKRFIGLVDHDELEKDIESQLQ